uniref:Uncharacterized protein n=1 Tax=Anguilla anguilla TaxID=7936 RepID=A0A0E9VUV8_ANGAN
MKSKITSSHKGRVPVLLTQVFHQKSSPFRVRPYIHRSVSCKATIFKV